MSSYVCMYISKEHCSCRLVKFPNYQSTIHLLLDSSSKWVGGNLTTSRHTLIVTLSWNFNCIVCIFVCCMICVALCCIGASKEFLLELPQKWSNGDDEDNGGRANTGLIGFCANRAAVAAGGWLTPRMNQIISADLFRNEPTWIAWLIRWRSVKANV